MPALLVSHGRPGFYFRVLEEGEVEAGDEIIKIQAGPEGMSVTEINGLLYLPGHPRPMLERALRVPALSAGWRDSFQALLWQKLSGDTVTGNPGLTSAEGSAPAWPGFRPLRVSRIARESDTAFSVELISADDHLGVSRDSDFYICGPPAFLRDFTAGLGVCHSCETALIAGSVNYNPEPLERPGEGKVLTCCSRPQGDMVADL
jgi:hypothetical protein